MLLAPTQSVSDEIVVIQKKLAKLKKKLDDLLIEELEAMSKEDLRARIASCAINLADIESSKDKDERLASCREELKELNGPYRESKTHQMRVMKFATLLLQEKGAS